MIYVAYDDIILEDDGNRVQIRSPSPYGMEDFYYSYHLPAIFMGQPENFNFIKLDDAIRSGIKFLYPLEFYSTFHAKIADIISKKGDFRLADNLNSDLLRAVRDGNCVVMFSDATESRNYDYKSSNDTVYVFDFIARFVVDNDLPPDAIWFVSGNPSGHIDHESWRLARGIYGEGYFNFEAENISPYHLRCVQKIRHDGVDINHYSTKKINVSSFQKLNIERDRSPETILSNINSNKNYFRSKEFVNYNGNIRSHRQMFISLLERENYIDRGYVSFRKSTPDPHTEALLREFDLYDTWKILENRLPLNVDLDNHKIESNFQTFFPRNKKYNNDSYLSFVSETWFFEIEGIRHTHITEKSIQPMINFQPLIIIGRSHALRTLRQYGYWTFSDFWDESYDDTINNIDRFKKIMDLISRLAKLSKSDIHNIYSDSIPIMSHNFNNFMNGPLRWEDIFKRIAARVNS